MTIHPEQLVNYTAAQGSETKDPNTRIVHEYTARAIAVTAIQEYVQPHRFLAIGDQDLDEVIRQDRLEYAEEERYEAELKQQLAARYQTNTATIYELPVPLEPAGFVQVVRPEQVAS